MTLNLLVLAGGLVAFAATAAAVRLIRTRSRNITTDHLSGDWLAHARAREEERW
jgi:hypothetical protein